MSDSISRQDAIGLKSEFLNPNVNRETEEQTAIDRAYARGWNSCNTHWIDEISEFPSAQTDIIRCKDCKYWGKRGLCEKWDHYISNEDFYCGCTERRTDEAD